MRPPPRSAARPGWPASGWPRPPPAHCAARATPRAPGAGAGRGPTAPRARSAARGARKRRRVVRPWLEAVLDRQWRRLGSRSLGRRLLRPGVQPQRLLELAGLVHLHDDVAAAHELAVDEQLGDGRPVREGRKLLSDPRVRQDVDGRERLSYRLQDGHRTGREPAGRLVRRSFHEQDHRVLGDRAGDLVAEGIAGLVAHAASCGTLVWMDRAWMRSPTSEPNTSYTRRCRASRLSSANSGADTTAWKWWPSPVTSALAPGIPASIRCLSSSGVADMSQA